MEEIILDKGDKHNGNVVKQGKCPNCNSTDLDYDAMEIDDDLIYYPWICNDCDTKGKEWYSLKFIGHNISE